MIYKVALKEQSHPDSILEVVHVRATTVIEAITKAIAYADQAWTSMIVYVGAVEETDIVLIEDD